MKRFNTTVVPQRFFAIMVLAFISIGLFATTSAVAAEPTSANFRVDNGIFKLGQKEPLTRTVTVFCDGIVYDFVLGSEKITIFNEAEGSFTMIDAQNGVQTVIPTQLLDKAIERLALRAAKKTDKETQFFYNPTFKPTQKDTASGELVFESPYLTYRVDAKQGDVKASKQYRRFADAYAKLNTVLHPGSNPPFARMVVNETLAESTSLPKAVQVTYGEETDPNAPRFRSEHRYEMKLDANDKERIEAVKESLETLKVIPFGEFQKL